jgi:type IV pilus assembly protein PilP
LAAALSMLVAGCASGDIDGLRAELKEKTRDLKGRIPPLPVVTPYQAFPYDVAMNPDPFGPAKIKMAVRTSPESSVRPDTDRTKEPLEAFPLETITMVGMLKKGRDTQAIVRHDGILHRVKVGNYMGQNFGKVMKIAEGEIVLREFVQDTAMDWVERTTVMTLQENEGKK